MASVVINTSSSGDATLVAAPGPRMFIRVLHYHVTALTAVTVSFKSNSTVKDVCYGTAAAAGGIATPNYPSGMFDCAPGEALLINLSAGVAVGGVLRYTILGQAP